MKLQGIWADLVAIVCALILLLIAFVLRSKSVKIIRDFVKMQKWKRARGMVSDSRIKEEMGRDGYLMYQFYIRYKFTVNDSEFVSEGRYLDEEAFSSSPATAQRLCRRYPAGTLVWVFYNPDDPEDAVINNKL